MFNCMRKRKNETVKESSQEYDVTMFELFLLSRLIYVQLFLYQRYFNSSLSSCIDVIGGTARDV
jgi:hypothetical protein